MNKLLIALTCALLPGVALAGPEQDVREVVKGNDAFALDLYAKLRVEEKGDLFFSPYSVSSALAMTWAGARGETEREMARVLHFTLGQDTLHPAMGALMTDLNGRKMKGRWKRDPDAGKRPYELVVANALWGQQGFPFRKAFLGLTRRSYEAGLNPLDFRADPEAARKRINAWVERKTKDRIKELIAEGMIDKATRLVLTNAIYFKSAWQEPFEKIATKDAPFHLTREKTAPVPTMCQWESMGYLNQGGLQVVSLPYKNRELSMLILIPKQVDGLASVERDLSPANLSRWLSGLKSTLIELRLPKFRITSSFQLRDVLVAMGMRAAFSPGAADFSGMADTRDLFIGAVIHKAFVDVDEKGTEAAAATAVIAQLGGGPPGQPVQVRVDRPFLFLIRDNRTGSILFMGRVTDPR